MPDRRRRRGRHGRRGRRIAGERVGLLVAAMAAVSPNLFYFDAMVVSESMVVGTTAAIVLLAAYRWWDRPTTRSALVFGLVIGVASLVRSEAVLLGPLIAVPLLWWRRGATGVRAGGGAGVRWLPQLAVAGAAAAVVVAPWVGYNMARFSEPVTLSAQFDQTLGTANCETVYFGDRVGYWSLACIPGHGAPGGRGRRVGAGEGLPRDRLPLPRPPRRVPYWWPRGGAHLGLYQPQEQIFLDTEVETKEPGLGQAGLFTWYVVAAAGLVGLAGLRRAGRPIFPLVAIMGSVVVTVAVIYGNTRFRLPAELALMFPAAVSADAALGGAARRWLGRGVPGARPWRPTPRPPPRAKAATSLPLGQPGPAPPPRLRAPTVRLLPRPGSSPPRPAPATAPPIRRAGWGRRPAASPASTASARSPPSAC